VHAVRCPAGSKTRKRAGVGARRGSSRAAITADLVSGVLRGRGVAGQIFDPFPDFLGRFTLALIPPLPRCSPSLVHGVPSVSISRRPLLELAEPAFRRLHPALLRFDSLKRSNDVLPDLPRAGDVPRLTAAETFLIKALPLADRLGGPHAFQGAAQRLVI